MIELRVADPIFFEWKTAEVTRSIEAVAGAFSLTVARTAEGLDNLRAFEDGTPCTLTINGQTVITRTVEMLSHLIGSGCG